MEVEPAASNCLQWNGCAAAVVCFQATHSFTWDDSALLVVYSTRHDMPNIMLIRYAAPLDRRKCGVVLILFLAGLVTNSTLLC